MSRAKLKKTIVAATAEDQVYVGLDVHASSIHVAVWKNGQVEAAWVTSADCAKLADQLEPLRPGLRLVAYEAGPTGFKLARLLASRSMPVIVCATSKIPRAAGPEAKTDRLDAAKLAEFAAKGLLKAVTVPTEEEEHARALDRRRHAMAKNVSRVKVQIKAMLLYHGCRTVSSWALVKRRQVFDQELSDEVRCALEGLFRELEFYEAEKNLMEVKLRELLAHDRHAETVKRLQTHPGVGPVVSACFRLELFRPERFKSAAAVARYVGLAPGVRQTGASCRGGPIMKSGQGKLRALLVEAAWVWLRRDEKARAIYGRLLANTGNAKKAIVGMARRLLIRLWMMSIYGKDYKSLARTRHPTA